MGPRRSCRCRRWLVSALECILDHDIEMEHDLGAMGSESIAVCRWHNITEAKSNLLIIFTSLPLSHAASVSFFMQHAVRAPGLVSAQQLVDDTAP